MEKKTGISFMVRVRNEENILEKSIRSLFSLKIPHEIVIILHCCTDKSSEIATSLQKENESIKIYKYEHEISRAGYENLATDITSNHSFIRYCNWCLSKTSMHWIFKWDADFIASSGLIDFLNKNTWEHRNQQYSIVAKNEDMNNEEVYLSCNLVEYKKYVFWEISYWSPPNETIYISKQDNSIYIEHANLLKDIKNYWNEEPWYIKENTAEANIVRDRIYKLEEDFGKNIAGMARASNSQCDGPYLSIIHKKPNYINLWE